jgi:elongation factor Ts
MERLAVVRSFATLDMIKELRTVSGAPIVECKKALQETDSNLQHALDWLREHGTAKASRKVQGRETTEGLVALCVSDNGKSGSLVKVASETDFAGRSKKFVELVVNVARATQTSMSTTLDQSTILQMSSGEKTIKELLDEAIVAIRENISVSNAVKFNATEVNSILVGYVHNRIDNSIAGTTAALVEVAGDIGEEDLEAIGKKLAMHIVAARPQYFRLEDVPSEVVEKEKAIVTAQTESSGKPPAIVDKIVEGRLRKFYEEICLIEQSHMIEEKNPKISTFLQDKGVTLKRYDYLTIK